MADEGPTFFGELKRFARTSGAVGGIAARLAGERFGLHTDRASHAEDLKAVLGGLKGPLMKVAQFLTTVPDVLPPEYAEELATLQANAPPMGWNFVRRRMASELGADWQAKFTMFSQTASSAASLGQVHRATLPDGTDVACKLQYPEMASTVESDLRQLRLALAVYRRMDSTIQQDDVYAELAERLREELDYTREAAQMRLYHAMMIATPTVHIPEPVEPYCTNRLLTMTWLDGRPLLARLAEDRRRTSATASPRRCFAPIMCRSTNTASFTAIRIWATTRYGRMAPSTCWISARCGSFHRVLYVASSICSRRCAITTTSARGRPTKPGVSAKSALTS
jgi:predicted unusual protein kinase regulating ubiquinone biosynthesis (AarF/ABC1/UbiB family)